MERNRQKDKPREPCKQVYSTCPQNSEGVSCQSSASGQAKNDSSWSSVYFLLSVCDTVQV